MRLRRALTPLLPAAAYAALSVADSIAAGRRSTSARRLRHVLKPALMPALTTAFLAGTREGPRPGTRVLHTGTAVGQAFSWGGDVALLGSGQRAFLTGVGSFFGAHVAYVGAFLSVRGAPADHDTAGLKAALAVWLTAGPVLSHAAGRKDPALRVPVAAYATILSGMFATSCMLDPALPARARRTMKAGTALFVISDTVLAAQMFLRDEPSPFLESLVMTTYTAGQGLIAAGVAQAT
ncbi:lysoplasmalogenase [Nocardioides campestrisoli]|uniref:lysoplasmalogenase n=1 Tax=Nocardioides campestrisoli TaxID=2736757 RepID=UPI0015E63E4A|nr:lysoplasmalogenase [Nocardioides campestrisoli]